MLGIDGYSISGAGPLVDNHGGGRAVLLFIDTNVFLSFFQFTNDDLEELRKLAVLVERRQVTLLFPEQVKSEFNRNRDNKIAEALKQLRSEGLSTSYPHFCNDFDEYKELRVLQQKYEATRKALLTAVNAAARERRLQADVTVSRLFDVATRLPVDQEVLAAARVRHEIGNPPGKRDSLGDAINWESLLRCEAEQGSDLWMVADDKDWTSALDSSQFNSYLSDEWRSVRGGSVHYYRRLSPFFGEHFPDIKLASELEANLLIEDLRISQTFAETHRAIGALGQVVDYTPAQARSIVDVYCQNTQVYWIIKDKDVRAFAGIKRTN